MNNYRKAFLLAVVCNLALAAALGIFWWRSRVTAGVSATQSKNPQAAAREPAPAPAPTPLSPVQLTPQRMQSIGVKTGVVEFRPVHDEIRAVGNVEIDERRQASVQVRFSGWIQKVFADSTYQFVRKGDPLFTIYSPELVTTQQEYLLARQSHEALANSSVPGVAAGANSLLSAAIARLAQWNVPAREIAELQNTGKVRETIEIDAPISGFVTERNALPNMYVQPGTKLYALVDLSTIWVYAQVFQDDISRLKAGNPASLTVDTYPERTFAGRIDFIWPQLDAATRTARVRVVFPNPDVQLKPGMFVNVRLEVPMGSKTTIPATAVLQSGARQIVFVDRGGGYLEPREVQLGTRVGDDYIVVKGVRAGEPIVTSANFLIDSESQMQAAIGSFVPPPPVAGGSSAASTSAAQATIEFTSQPSPPRRGDNVFRAKLTGNGAPVAGAQVTMTFYMAAMPAMGMASMRAVATLNDKGNGMYEGSGQLQSGGTWQVTIVAQKAGHTIATKTFTVDATGGM